MDKPKPCPLCGWCDGDHEPTTASTQSFSDEYTKIRNHAEQNWPEWRKRDYNRNASAHSILFNVREQ